MCHFIIYYRSDTHSRIEVIFRIEMDVASQGLMLLRKHENSLLGGNSVLAIAIVDGYLEAGLGDGKEQLMRIQYKTRRLDDGLWHTAIFDRYVIFFLNFSFKYIIYKLGSLYFGLFYLYWLFRNAGY